MVREASRGVEKAVQRARVAGERAWVFRGEGETIELIFRCLSAGPQKWIV